MSGDGLDGKLRQIRLRFSNGHIKARDTTTIIDTELDDRDVSLLQLSQGTLLATFFSSDSLGEPKRLSVVRSNDDGHTWGSRIDIDSTMIHQRFRWLATTDAPVELGNGELLMPVYGLMWDDSAYSSHTLRSADGGRTWTYNRQLARDASQNISFSEPAIVRDGDVLIATMRTAGDGPNAALQGGTIYESRSLDGGATWTPAVATDVWGYPTHMLGLDSRTVLMTYGYRRAPYGVRYSLSTDAGSTWPQNASGVLDTSGTSAACGYPSTVRLEDQSLVTVYYLTRDALTSIKAVRYRLD